VPPNFRIFRRNAVTDMTKIDVAAIKAARRG